MGPFTATCCDHLAIVFLSLLLWVVPRMLPAGGTAAVAIGHRQQRLELKFYTDALLAARRRRTARRVQGQSHEAA